MEEKIKVNRRRRERAKKMRDEIVNSKVLSEDSCEEMPIVRAKPPRPRKRTKDPIFEEDLIDGFAVMAFRSFDDLERCVRLAEKTNSHVLDPYPDRVKCEMGHKRLLPKINSKTLKGSRYSTEEEGYICDRESDGDKMTDVDDSLFYSSCLDLVERKHLTSLNLSSMVLDTQHSLIVTSVSSSNLPISLRADDCLSKHTDSFYKSPVTVPVTSMIATTCANDVAKIIVKEEPSFNCQTPNLFDQKPNAIEEMCDRMIYEDKSQYSDKKYPIIDQKPLIDTKPPLFSPINACPQSSFNNSLFRPHFNVITTTSTAPTTSTVTSTTASSTVSSINHIADSCPVTSQSSISNKNRFSVSSLVSGSNLSSSDYIASSAPPVEPTTHPSVIRPHTVKSYPLLKSPIPSVVSKPHSSTLQNISKSPHPPIKSVSSFGTSNSSFSNFSGYGPTMPIVHATSQYPIFPHSKATTTYSHDIKIESGEYCNKPPSKMPAKVTVPHIIGPSSGSHPSNFGALPIPLTLSPHQKTLSLVGGIVKRESSNGTPPRPTTPHSNFVPRYSPRMQDPHRSIYNSSPSSLGNLRLLNFARTSGASSAFPLSAPISSPLPPSGMFAPHQSVQSLGPPPILGSGNSLAQDPLAAQADLLRRELDSRFLATQDRTAVGMAASNLGSIGAVPTLLRTDVHHHQHQHTHVHQHLLPQLPPPAPSGIFSHSSNTPSLFKEVSKVGMESGLYHQRSGLSSFSSGLSSLITPNNSSTHVPNQMAPVSKKNGRWNVMHIRLAWEIYYDQQKQAATKGVKLGSSDILRTGPGMPGTPSLYSSLSRPNDHLGSMLSQGSSSHRLEGSSFLGGVPITPSVPGFRYSAAQQPSHNSQFPSSNITPTNISGPAPGSMFSRESAPSGLSMPAPVHDPWRIRAPVPFGNTNSPSWHHKADQSYFEGERREQEERERRDRQEKERKEREERQRREEQERREKEKREREERERREREEKQREREKRAEHEKERLARLEAYNERGGLRREDSRSPLRFDSKGVLGHHFKHDSRSGTGTKYDSSKDEITIVGSKEGNTRQAHATTSHLGPPVMTSAPYLGSHTLSSVATLERARILNSGFHPPSTQPPLAHWADPLRGDPYHATMASVQDPFAVARAHDLAARESFLASRDHLRDPLRDSLDRAREEHLMRANPLGTMILNERYREHQVAREMIERERQYVAAAAAAAGSVPGSIYSHPSLLPPHPVVSVGPSMLPPPMTQMKLGSPMGHPHVPHPSMHPQQLGVMYPTAHLGHPSLAPGLPPPLIPSLAAAGQTLSRPTDKKDVPK